MLLEKGVFSGGNTMNRLLSGVSAGVIMLACAMGAAKAADLPGKFEGVTIDAKLIGGQQYEKLYERIGEWEKATGAKVNILSKRTTSNWTRRSSPTSPPAASPGGRFESFLLRAAISGHLCGPLRPHPFRGSGQIRAGGDRRLDARRQARHAAAGAVRRLRAVFPEEPLSGRGEEDRIQGQIRL